MPFRSLAAFALLLLMIARSGAEPLIFSATG
jgi:hypothetical protein